MYQIAFGALSYNFQWNLRCFKQSLPELPHSNSVLVLLVNTNKQKQSPLTYCTNQMPSQKLLQGSSCLKTTSCSHNEPHSSQSKQRIMRTASQMHNRLTVSPSSCNSFSGKEMCSIISGQKKLRLCKSQFCLHSLFACWTRVLDKSREKKTLNPGNSRLRLPSSSPSSSFSGSMSSAWVIQSKQPFRSSSNCCFSRSFWKSPRALAFSRSLENSLQRGKHNVKRGSP